MAGQISGIGKAVVMRVFSDRHAEYKGRHDEIWPKP